MKDKIVTSNDVGAVTNKIIRTIYMDKAILASLRGAVSITSLRAQTVWPVLIANLDEGMLSRSGKPTYAERAIYAAIRLYAISQQGPHTLTSPEDNKSKSKSFFDALANLRQNELIRVALDRRVQMLLKTTNINGVINSLVHLLEILKANKMAPKIDYPLMAKDLYKFQFGYEQSNQVRLRWGQQYFRSFDKITKSEGK
ncbi:type I-E CRISPR-associated protein Cse2/CasB [Lentilactobacillus raoultii]|uniref:Type I-E CRISPR-associated protein Cse2/CasB n=1 Tax=Lentilactobacillus raoultii TaxID=1987503 RepID=A0ABW3PGT2_9LACO|nr:type I-E CRISPR-associated protein Cse2/CasB [Lentilactobacillus raoultii]